MAIIFAPSAIDLTAPTTSIGTTTPVAVNATTLTAQAGSLSVPGLRVGAYSAGLYEPYSGQIGVAVGGSFNYLFGGTALTMGSGVALRWTVTSAGDSSDISLLRDSASILAQRSSTLSQTYRLYKSYTDTSNYTRTALQFDSNGIVLAGESAGTGDANISVTISPKGTGSIRAIRKLYLATDANAAQAATGLYGGTGAPSNANGSDGDFYFRSDGGALTTIYQRRSGAWSGIV